MFFAQKKSRPTANPVRVRAALYFDCLGTAGLPHLEHDLVQYDFLR
ncbi:hypothetical protein DSOL_5180 [Desulfosporosinus metallidurans]|uniref:Uncharacterized protein n=1 Tax=Desulfosporosinus metallidurans TaxID=1888891 RepID=A0A1Q8QF39_9FIRM|nr:hypothetical protein DSOL_5180 [Desulfosporosinus metallidurans]